MGKAQRISLILVALLALGAKCSGDDAAFLLAETVLGRVEQQHRVDVIVFTKNLSGDARRAAAKLRKTVEIDSVPSTTENLIPPHYLIFNSLTIAGNSAQLDMTLGPIPQAAPGTASLSCGTGYTFHFQRDLNGQWKEGAQEIVQC